MNIWTTADRANTDTKNNVIQAFDPAVCVHKGAAPQSPVVFAFPHSGRKYPDFFMQQTPLALLQLRSSEDAYVDQLFQRANAPSSTFVKALFPRSWVDANRHPGALDGDMFIGALPVITHQRPQVDAGLGVIPKVVAANQNIYRHRLKVSEIEKRLSNTHKPYHRALDNALARARQKFGFSWLIDCHSMPSVCAINSLGGTVDVVLGDRHGSSCAPELSMDLARCFVEQGLSTAKNVPYAGGYSLYRHAQPENGAYATQIELSRALYMDEAILEKTGNFVALSQKLGTIMQQIEQIAIRVANK